MPTETWLVMGVGRAEVLWKLKVGGSKAECFYRGGAEVNYLQ